jgi:hypothetical protein
MIECSGRAPRRLELLRIQANPGYQNFVGGTSDEELQGILDERQRPYYGNGC